MVSLCMFIVKCLKFSLLRLLRNHHSLLHFTANLNPCVDCGFTFRKQDTTRHV